MIQLRIFTQLLIQKYVPVQKKKKVFTMDSYFSISESMPLWKNSLNKENLYLCQIQQSAYVGNMKHKLLFQELQLWE